MHNNEKIVLITGSAGFIGSHLSKRLLEENYKVIGFDNLNDYYDVNLKKSRINDIKNFSEKYKYKWEFFLGELEDKNRIFEIFNSYSPNIIIHLAAQAGVRYSIENPFSYVNSNLVGFINILEASREKKVEHLIYASSSSVYGGNQKTPYSEKDKVNHPVSLYAATKKSNELMAHSYSHLFNIPCTALRLFTVYGPWGRPDMAPMIFADSIFSKRPIKIFNFGEMSRSFTYIDDVINAIQMLIRKPAHGDDKFDRKNPNPSTSWAPHRIFNIGNKKSVDLESFISLLENEIGIKAIKNYAEMQAGDVKNTLADTSLLENWIGHSYETPLPMGIQKFISWYRKFYRL